MEREPFVLGFILRKFPEFNFSMESFNDRLRLQKFIYLLQTHNVYLGYDFSWYIRGPYCTTLSTAGFILADFYEQIPKRSRGTRFANGTIQKRFERFAKFIKGKEGDAKFLEAAASLHFLLNTSKITYYDAIKEVADKMPDTDKTYVGEVRGQMKSEGLL